MKRFVLAVMMALYGLSFVGCAEYKISDIKKSIMTMNENGQKEIEAQKAKEKE